MGAGSLGLLKTPVGSVELGTRGQECSLESWGHELRAGNAGWKRSARSAGWEAWVWKRKARKVGLEAWDPETRDRVFRGLLASFFDEVHEKCACVFLLPQGTG